MISNIQEQVLKEVYYNLCNLKVYEIKIASGAVRGKTGKTSVIPGLSKIECGRGSGSGSVLQIIGV